MTSGTLTSKILKFTNFNIIIKEITIKRRPGVIFPKKIYIICEWVNSRELQDYIPREWSN